MKKTFFVLWIAMVASILPTYGIGSFNLLEFKILAYNPGPGGIFVPIGGNQHPKSAVEAPCVYQDGSLLTFESELEGCTVFLVDEDENVVFSESIEENQTSLTMPTYLSGTYLLEIISGNYVFYCEIEL